jgi:aminoglycoside/choline kinase family phosphotransferase
MHEREVRGYRDVLPVVMLPSPTCYFADYDADRRQGIVIMEDLVTRGVTFCHASRPQTADQIYRRLTVLARYHACTWTSTELNAGGRWADLVDFFDVMQQFFEMSTEPQTWHRFVTSPRGAATSVRFHDREWLIDAWSRLVRYAQQLPYCVLHGDVHLGNLYIERDGTPGFLDTLASRGPGMLEVSYHISASLDTFDREASEQGLVLHYLDELSRNGAASPSFDEAMLQYRLFLLYGHIIWMTTEPHMQTEAVNTANAARVSAAMIHHRTVDLLKAL